MTQQSQPNPLDRLAKIRQQLLQKTKFDIQVADAKPIVATPVIPTGSLSLDNALGVGGIPQGRVVEVFGPEASGKTTLMLHMIANAQKLGGVAGFIDAEHALDLNYAKALGVDLGRLMIHQPDHGEQALELADALLDAMTAPDIVVVDSVASLVPKAEIDGEIGDQFVGLQARMMSQALRRLVVKASQTGATLLLTNQVRQAINTGGFGPRTTQPGGNALKFYSSVRLEIKRIGSIKEGGSASTDDSEGASAIGNRVKIKVVKNKVAPPFKEIETTIMFGKGIRRVEEILDHAIKLKIIGKSGGWHDYKGSKLGNGRENVIAYMESEPFGDSLADIEAEVIEALSKLACPQR